MIHYPMAGVFAVELRHAKYLPDQAGIALAPDARCDLAVGGDMPVRDFRHNGQNLIDQSVIQLHDVQRMLFRRGSACPEGGEVQFKELRRDRFPDDVFPVDVIQLQRFGHGAKENDVHALDIPKL